MKPFNNSPHTIRGLYASKNPCMMMQACFVFVLAIFSGLSPAAPSDYLRNNESIHPTNGKGINCPSEVTLPPEKSQSEIDILFEHWKNEFSVSMDCLAEVIYKVDGKVIDFTSLNAPDACGGVITVTREIISPCLNQICESTFTIESPPLEIIISFPIVDFTCWNQTEAPTYAALPASSLTRVLAFSIYSPCIDLKLLSLTTEDLPIQIVGPEYHFKRKYVLSSEQGFSSVGYEIFDIYYDPEAPVMVGVPNDITLPCGAELPRWPEVTATDMENALEVIKKQTVYTEPCGGRYYVRTWSATDPCHNTSIKSQKIYFEDNTPPWITIPSDTTIDCAGQIPPPTYEAGDQGCSSFRIEFDEQKIVISSCEYDLIRTWKVIDGCEQSIEKSQIIRIRDLVGPEIIPVAQNLKGISTGDEIETYNCDIPNLDIDDFNVTDHCCNEVQIQLISDLIADDACSTFSYYRKWKCGVKATDSAGNTTEFYFYLINHDTTPPIIYNVPDHITIECNSEIPPVPDDVFAIDDCSQTIISEFSERESTDNTEGGMKAIIRNWTFHDKCGNKSEAIQRVNLCLDTSNAHFASYETVFLDNAGAHRFQCGDNLRYQKPASSLQVTDPKKSKADYLFKDLQVWPNPTDDYLSVLIKVLKENAGTLSIYNFTGELIKRKEMNLHVGVHKEHLELSTFPAGTYLLQIMINGHNQNIKFIKNR